jgi:hypothetical protein
MSVRAKFVCIAKSGMSPNDNEFYLQLIPVTTGSEENEKFFSATPAGKLELQIVNEKAAEQIECGKEYYIDISPAE